MAINNYLKIARNYSFQIRLVAGASPGFGRILARFFFSDYARHAAHGEAMRFARRVRGHAPTRNFFKMVQFGAFWCIF